jgi:hypothetical protein
MPSLLKEVELCILQYNNEKYWRLDGLEDVDHGKVTTQRATEKTYLCECDRDNNQENVEGNMPERQ